MSRLTGSDVKSMMEAYNAVYAPQEEIELTEEQVWVEVENWVNSLLEEGYDLSEYTWEEMYETYLSERSPNESNIRGGSRDRGTGIRLPGGSTGSGLGRQGAKRAADARASAPRLSNIPPSAGRPQVSNIPPQEGTGRGAPGAGSQPSQTPSATPPTPSPGAPAATPRPAAAPRPAAGQTGDKAKGTATWSKANPTLASRVTPSGTQAGTGQSQMSKQASELRAMRQRSQERQGVKTEEYDAYDLVLEYLLAEGHADTLEEANYVMLEMDAEMVQDIVEKYKN